MTREQEIRARLKTASRTFAWLGAVGVAKADVEYLLDKIEELERIHQCAEHLHTKLRALDIKA